MPFLIAFAILLVLGISTAFGSFFTVDQTERAVLTRNGAIVSIEAPGFHLKAPFIDSATKLYVTDKLIRYEKMEGYSHDQQASHYQISVNFRAKPDAVGDIYSRYGDIDNAVARVITPAVYKLSKVVIGNFTAQTSIQERGRLNSEIERAVKDATENSPLQITNVNVEDIKFGADYEAGINKRMIAEVNVQTSQQNLANEKVLATIVTTQAQAAADAQRAQGQATNDIIKGRGEAEASAIEAKAKALGQNPNLVTLIQAEKWNGALPTTMVPGSAVPFVSVK